MGALDFTTPNKEDGNGRKGILCEVQGQQGYEG
jgi:hypothetical protein